MNVTSPAADRQPPALDDWATKTLVRLLAEAWRTGERPLRFRDRGATLDDLRIELRRRETRGVGVDR